MRLHDAGCSRQKREESPRRTKLHFHGHKSASTLFIIIPRFCNLTIRVSKVCIGTRVRMSAARVIERRGTTERAKFWHNFRSVYSGDIPATAERERESRGNKIHRTWVEILSIRTEELPREEENNFPAIHYQARLPARAIIISLVLQNKC